MSSPRRGDAFSRERQHERSVMLLSAKVEVRATAPAYWVTQ